MALNSNGQLKNGIVPMRAVLKILIQLFCVVFNDKYPKQINIKNRNSPKNTKIAKNSKNIKISKMHCNHKTSQKHQRK